jgi:hypothetical protein
MAQRHRTPMRVRQASRRNHPEPGTHAEAGLLHMQALLDAERGRCRVTTITGNIMTRCRFRPYGQDTAAQWKPEFRMGPRYPGWQRSVMPRAVFADMPDHHEPGYYTGPEIPGKPTEHA